MSYLVDTNVISELRKGARCNDAVAAWWSTVAPDEVYLSVLTIGEIQKGIENIRRRDTQTAAVLDVWVLGLIHRYGARILPIDIDIADEWGRLNAPDQLPVIDGLLAATAKLRHLTLVSRNVIDFARSGVVTLNPWLG